MSDEVGSLADEAAKLAAALSQWAKDLPGADSSDSTAAPHPTGPEPPCRCQSAAECRVCPLCRGMHVVRTLKPEVRTQLAVAAASLMQAAATILSGQGHEPTAGPDQQGSDPGEHISLDDEDWESDKA